MRRLAVTSALVLPVLAACVAVNEMPTRAEGAQIFAENCVSCHAVGGAGPDLTRIAARNGGVFDRAAVLSQIDGFSRGQHADLAMPEFGLTLTGETVPVEVDGVLTPTPRPLAALLEYLESVQG
jgi:mono/diheme cytochrome c family protein